MRGPILSLICWRLAFAAGAAGGVLRGSLVTRFVAVALAFLVAVVALAGQAWAASCAPRDKTVADLEDRYGVAPLWRGLTTGGILAELWLNAETGTWIYLGTTADGKSCIVSFGPAGELIQPPPAGEPA